MYNVRNPESLLTAKSRTLGQMLVKRYSSPQPTTSLVFALWLCLFSDDGTEAVHCHEVDAEVELVV